MFHLAAHKTGYGRHAGGARDTVPVSDPEPARTGPAKTQRGRQALDSGTSTAPVASATKS